MTGDVLERICAEKRRHISEMKSAISHKELEKKAKNAPSPRPFAAKLQEAARQNIGLIAEIKRASPSKGRIRADFDPARLAEAYLAGGAICLSVLTDTPYFEGRPEDLMAARAAVPLPVLRKDFMLAPYQITESRAMGADCILLIMAALRDEEAADLEALALDYGMSVLIEVHDKKELERALRLKSPLIGINNRNLKTLDVDIGTGLGLAVSVPTDRLVIAESGIRHHDDIGHFKEHGVSAFLVGESLMRQSDVAAATRALLGQAA